MTDVKAAKARDDFQPYLDDAEIAHQIQMRGRQRRVARLTLKALERLLQADDLIIVNLGIEKVLRLGKLGLLPNEDDDEGGGATPVSPGARRPALPSGVSVQDQIATCRDGYGRDVLSRQAVLCASHEMVCSLHARSSW